MTSPTPGPATTPPVASATGMPTMPPPTATAMTNSISPPAVTSVAPSASDGGLTAAVLSGAVIAAAVTAVVSTVLARRGTRLEERARVRDTLAEAYRAYADYKEFPYAIRRRRTDQKEAERVRLSEELRKIQSRISYYQAWTQAESPETGAAYNELISAMRRVAGAAMHEAWKLPGLDNDQGMNIGTDRVDLTSLKPAEEKFIAAMETHVAAVTEPWWKRTISWIRS
jgi:hypothetical protein